MSSTIIGLVIAIAGTILVQFGFTDVCAGEITTKIASILPLIIGGGMAWRGRVKAGGVSWLGIRQKYS